MGIIEIKDRRINEILKRKMIRGNAEKLREFNAEYQENGVGIHSRYTYILYLCKLNIFLKKPFKEAEKKDIINFMHSLTLNENSKSVVKQRIKTFYKWLNGGTTSPPAVKWIKIKSKQPEKIDAANTLKHDDILAMIQVCPKSRDKAILSLLYESACRIREFTGLKIKDFQIEGNTAWLKIEGKGGIVRKITIINSVPYITRWLNDHPDRNNPNAPLFVSRNVKKFTRAGITSIILQYAEKSKIKKPVNPHWFRHSRITEVSQIFNEAELRNFAGWTATSKMPARYIHESEDIMAEKLKKRAGMKIKEKIFQDELRPKVCVYCGTVNEADSNFCNKCASPLNTKAAMESQETKAELAVEIARMKTIEAKLETFDSMVLEMKALKDQLLDKNKNPKNPSF